MTTDRAQPDFMIVGAQKCGTSTLAEILSSHPSIESCTIKEPHYFSTHQDWRAGLHQYEALFQTREDCLLFEASTSYTFSPLRAPEIWKAIYSYNPAMKFIYLVRNPLDRIVSNYMHMYSRGYTKRSIEDSIQRNRMYIDVSRFATQILPYIRQFGRDQVLLIDFDDLNARRESVVRDVAAFIGVDSTGFQGFEQVHANRSIGRGKRHHRYDEPSLPLRLLRKLAPPLWDRLVRDSGPRFRVRPRLSPSFKRMILDQLELDIRETERLLDKDLRQWRQV